MKKIVSIALVSILALALTGCIRTKITTINVKVENNGKPVVRTLVYMYETTINDYTYSNTYMAEKAVPTEDDGIASFPLDGFEFIGNADQVSFRFVTYDASGYINGNALTTVKYGKTKNILIEQQ